MPAAAHDDYSLNPPKDPVTLSFSGHKGCVLDIQCSPFSRDFFLSCGSDHEIRLYSLLQVKKHTYVHIFFHNDIVNLISPMHRLT